MGDIMDGDHQGRRGDKISNTFSILQSEINNKMKSSLVTALYFSSSSPFRMTMTKEKLQIIFDKMLIICGVFARGFYS